MKVCLINPPQTKTRFSTQSISQPLGLAYVAATLEEYNHEVSIIDAPIERLTCERIALKIKDHSPSLVGITVPFSMLFIDALVVAMFVKTVNEKIITVLGGSHPSARPLECLQTPYIDYVVVGEGEETMPHLLYALEEKLEELEYVQGIAYKNHINPPRLPNPDLDRYQYPARHLLPMDKYFAEIKHNPPRGEITKPYATMITSRGCPYKCVFCSAHVVMGRTWRFRSPQNVVNEIEELIQTYHIKQIDFEDDNMTFSRKRMLAICNLILERGLDIEWFTPNGVRADTLNEPLLEKMAKSGCKRLWFSPETGVQRVLDQIIHKNMSLDKMEKVIFSARKHGIKIGCNFVIGFIGETKADIRASIKYAYKLKKLGVDRFWWSIATPLYGSELYKQAKELGYLRNFDDSELTSCGNPLFETPEWTKAELSELYGEAKKTNPSFNYERLKRAVRNPSKIIKYFGR